MNEITKGKEMCYIRFTGEQYWLEMFHSFMKKLMNSKKDKSGNEAKITFSDIKESLRYRETLSRDYEGVIDFISEVLSEDMVFFITMQTVSSKSENEFWDELLKEFNPIVCDIVNFVSEGVLQSNQVYEF